MISLRIRSNELEIMDDLACEGEVVDQTLRELEFINRWLGGNQVTLSGIADLLKSHPTEKKLTVADLGCGGGDMLKLIHAWGERRGISFSLVGIDANPNIIKFANANGAHSSISFEAENVFSSAFGAKKFDVITATLFTHHFTSSDLVKLFKQWQAQARLGVVINDLHRHSLAYYSILFLTRLFSRSTMVKFDAPLSVRRGFTRRELKEILNQSGITHYSLRWQWAFRWKLVIPGHGR